MKEKLKKGRLREDGAFRSLRGVFDGLELVGNQAPMDFIARDGEKIIGINVKSGKGGYYINQANLRGLMRVFLEKNVVPSFLLLDEAGDYLFTLDKIIPSENGVLRAQIHNREEINQALNRLR